MAQAHIHHEKIALIYFDLDDFKLINDKMGHSSGDYLLTSIGKRLNDFVSNSEFVARVGGDEFCIVVSDFKQRSELENTSKRLIELCAKEIDLVGIEIKTGISIGIAIYPDHADNFAALLHKADATMYKVKNSTKKNYAFTV